MSDFGDASQESTSELTESPELTTESVQTEDHSTQSQEQQEPANPFWGEVEQLTGPNVYKLIQPHLAKADTEARNRISALNQSFAPWKQLSDQGISPENVQQAIGVVQRLNDPNGQVEIFEGLRTFLEREGRLPSQAELQNEVEDNEEDDEVDPRDVQLKQLQDQQNMLAGYLQQQRMAEQQQAASQEADTWLGSELDRLKQANPDLGEADLQEVIRIAAFQVQQTGKAPDNFDGAVAQYNAMRDRIRTTPRPGQFAPRVPSGVGGGSVSGGPVDTSSMSKSDRLALVANMLQQGKNN